MASSSAVDSDPVFNTYKFLSSSSTSSATKEDTSVDSTSDAVVAGLTKVEYERFSMSFSVLLDEFDMVISFSFRLPMRQRDVFALRTKTRVNVGTIIVNAGEVEVGLCTCWSVQKSL